MKTLGPEDLTGDESKWLRIIVYGTPGSGKTWFCASAALCPETSPVLYIDYRGQVSSLARNPEYVEAMRDGRLVLVRPQNPREVSACLSWVRNACKGKNVPLPGVSDYFQQGPPKTVVLDSVTEIQRDIILAYRGHKPSELISEPGQMQIQQWGGVLEKMASLARYFFFYLPVHTIMSCLEASEIDELERRISVVPALAGQSAKIVPAYALTVIRLVASPGKSGPVITGYTSARGALVKDQSTLRLPPEVKNPTVCSLISHMPALAGQSPANSESKSKGE